MPSRTEMRCWLLLALALAWGSVLWVVWEWWHAAAPASATLAESLAQVHQLWTSAERTTWGTLVGLGFGLLACTRFAWCWLRQDGTQ